MFEKIKDIIVENLGVKEEEVTLDASLTDDLGADSLDAVELIMAIEDEFDISINDSDAQAMKTVQNIVDYLNK
ncbi:acyl carrier protein [Mycoplasmatota bacterium]|nr:acyl carrier protein [Mycoplasmatota bacterium]